MNTAGFLAYSLLVGFFGYCLGNLDGYAAGLQAIIEACK